MMNDKIQFLKKVTSDRTTQIRAIAVIWIVVAVLASLAWLVRAINDWYSVNQFVFHKAVEVKFQKPITVEKRKPLEVLSPIAKEVISPKDDLSPIERKIVDKFGERYGYVAIAVFRCESGLRPEAVNWSTKDVGIAQINWPVWEKPIKEKFGYTLADMFDVDKNLDVALWIWDRDGDGVGSFDPWVALDTRCFIEEFK